MAPDDAEQVVRALGITVVAATAALREEFGFGDREGVVITAVTGVAREKGLERGDLIIDVNGVIPASPIRFFETIRQTSEDEPVRLEIWRKGETIEFELPLQAPPPRVPERREGQFQV